MYSYFGAGLVPSYGATKGSIVLLTKAMAVELPPLISSPASPYRLMVDIRFVSRRHCPHEIKVPMAVHILRRRPPASDPSR
jgi:hypothetical protein